jgi:hypothetical protein
MNLLSLTLLNRELAPGNLHALFFSGLALCAIVAIIVTWKRGGNIRATCGAAAFVLTMFYLTSPYAGDAVRWSLSVAILLTGFVLFLRNRHRTWTPLLIASVTLISLVVVFLTSSSVNLLFFETYFTKGATFYFLSCLTWLIIKLVIPRTRGKQQAVQAAGMAVIIALVMFIVALVSWLEAVDANVLPNAPVATTGTEVSALFARPRGERRLGIFAVGVIGDLKNQEDGAENSNFLSYYIGAAPRLTEFVEGDSYFPLQFDLRMADGQIVNVTGIHSAKQAFEWPEGGPRPWQVALKPGDPVVIWAEPGGLLDPASGTKTPSLTGTRVLAYGSLNHFRETFLADLVKTSRVFGWIFFGCMFLSLIPLGFGIRHRFKHKSPPAAKDAEPED